MVFDLLKTLCYYTPIGIREGNINKMNHTQTKYHINDADNLIEEKKFLLDVREPVEFELGHITGAENISVNDWNTGRLSCLKIERYTCTVNVVDVVTRQSKS